jgi:streptogramin lyase
MAFLRFPSGQSFGLRAGRGHGVALLAGLCLVLLAMTPALQATGAPQVQFSYAIGQLNVNLNSPAGVAVDAGGNLYVADSGAKAVYEIPYGCGSNSCKKTLPGSYTTPVGVAVDASGNVYVADQGNNAVKMIPPGCATASCVTTVGGGFTNPTGVAVDNSGFVYLTDNSLANAGVYKMAASCTSASCVQTLPGSYSHTFGVAVDSSGNVYVTDTPAGYVGEIPAGCTTASCVKTLPGASYFPMGVAVDGSGNVYVAEDAAGVREIPAGCTTASCVKTLPGSYGQPAYVAVDSSGNVYVTEQGNNAVTELMTNSVNFFTQAVGTSSFIELTFTFTAPGSIGAPVVLTQGATGLDFTDAGTGTCTTNGASYSYSVNATCTVDVTFTPQFPGLRMGAVELVDTQGNFIAWVPVYGVGSAPLVAINPSTQTKLGGGFSTPYGVAVDAGGYVYVTDDATGKLYEMSKGCATSTCVTTLDQFSRVRNVAVDGFGNQQVAVSGNHTGIAVDGSRNVYVTDPVANTVYENLNFCTSSCQKTLGGGFKTPMGVAVDGSGNVYVADQGNNAVKMIPPGCASASCVMTLGGPINGAFDLAVDSAGNLYVTDNGSTVWEIPAGCTTASCMTTLASGFTAARGVAVDGSGNVYVADHGSTQITAVIRNVATKTLNFPTATLVGTTDSTDGPQTVTVTNIGNALLTFTRPTTAGVNNPSVAQNFSYNSSSSCTQTSSSSAAAFKLAAGASCTIAVDLAPEWTGSLWGNLILTDDNNNVSGAQQAITFGGTGTGPVVSLTPPSFSNQAENTTSTARAALLLNTGNTTLTGIAVSILNGDSANFALVTGSNACGTTLAINTGCSIYVTFTPNAIRSFSTDLQVTSSNAVTTTATLSGTGIGQTAQTLTSLSPAYTNAGGAAFTLTLDGTGFTSTSVVYWGTTALTTTNVSATQLTAVVPATLIATQGTYALTVQTANETTSNSMMFEVDSASASTNPSGTPTITSTTATVTAGSPASYPVSVPSTVTQLSVTCLNLPAGATCSYSSGVLVITTSASTPKGTYPVTVVFTETVTISAAMIAAPFLLSLLIGFGRRPKARALWICLGLVLLAATFLATGCGGHASTPNSESVSSSKAVTLTVQ